jgi:hypothetical protein
MEEKCENIQFLIVGMAHEHIFKIIHHFQPLKLYLICSFEMEDSIKILNDQIKGLNIDTQILYINPFKEDSLQQITSEIIWRAKKEIIEHANIKIYIGFTGGTNLMAIAAGYSAMILNAESHYVLKDTDEILVFKPKEIVSSLKNSF